MRTGRWYGWIVDRWDALRGSYWFFPALMALASGAVALFAVETDRRLPADWGEQLPWLTKVSAEGARAVLSTIAGSMMTVTGVVFSITVVALTLTSSQFGPRLLRTFFRDRGSQLALGTFLATFCYSLLVLRAVGTPERVPYLATAGAVVLAGVSLFVLIYFVHHAASSIQASSVIAAVAWEIREQLPTLFPEALGEARERRPDDAELERIQRLDRAGLAVAAEAEGYVRVLDDQGLLDLAQERDWMVRLVARPGSFVTRGSILAHVLDASSGQPPGDGGRAGEVRACWLLGNHRTPVQDLSFLTGQLTEMAVRALSPGVNDPKTAVECAHRLGAVVAQLGDREMPSGLRYDPEGKLRVVSEPTRFGEVTGSCFDPIRRYGAHDPQVTCALLGAIAAGAAACSEAERLDVLAEHAREVYDAFGDSEAVRSKRDRAFVDEALAHVNAVLEARRDRSAQRGNS